MASKFLDFCEQGEMVMIVEELNKGFDVNTGDEGGWTGLICAASRGQSQVCQLLIKNGANLDIANNNGSTALYMACQDNHADCAKILIDAGADVDTKDHAGFTPVMISSQYGQSDCLKLLIGAGANINISTNAGCTPLWEACQKNNIECVKLLVQAGADVDTVNPDGASPVMISGQKGHSDCLKLLIGAGAKLNLQDINGRTAVSSAGDLDCVKVLVEGGADVNIVDSGGFSPLSYASQKGEEEIAVRLIEAGADPAFSGWNGNDCLHLAAWGGRDTLFLNSVWFDSSAERINKPNHYGYTPLHLAALGNHTSIVQFLLDHGADINLQTNFGETPFHCAVMGGNHSCIESIAKASKLDGSLKNVRGLTAAELYRQQYPDQSLPDSIREKVNLPDACQLPSVIPAKKFVEVAKLKETCISLKSVKLIKRAHFLKAGEIPHYNTCELKKWHLTAEDVNPSHNVLFLSHRWGSDEHPDPDGAQYKIAVEFLNSSEGRDIEFIWADYSSICQNKESDLFLEHLKNIPTAVWTATHFLVIPKLVQATGVTVTHLKDYLGRGWCVLEAMAGVMTGTECHLGFQVGKHISFEQFDRPEGAASNLGFYQSKVNVFNRLIRENHPDFLEAGGEIQGVLWKIVEPCAIIGLLIKICKSTRSEVQAIVQKALNLDLNLEDIQSAPEEITQIWNMMGECKVEADKVPVMNLMLFIGYYSLYMPSSSEMDSGSFGTGESKETEVTETEERTVEEESVIDQKVECTCDLM